MVGIVCFGICVITVCELVIVIRIQVKYPGLVVTDARYMTGTDGISAVRIVIIVPVSVRAPGIVPVIIIAVTVTAVIKIGIIKIRPHGPVMNFHTQVAVIIVFIIALVFTIIFIVVCLHVLIMLALGREIYVIGSLPGFVSRRTAA
jgi:hypothetical protein